MRSLLSFQATSYCSRYGAFVLARAMSSNRTNPAALKVDVETCKPISNKRRREKKGRRRKRASSEKINRGRRGEKLFNEAQEPSWWQPIDPLIEDLRLQLPKAVAICTGNPEDYDEAQYMLAMEYMHEAAEETGDEEVKANVLHCAEDTTFFACRINGYRAVIGESSTSLLLRKQPELVLLSPELLAHRLLQLKEAFPGSNLRSMAEEYPWMLLVENVKAIRILPGAAKRYVRSTAGAELLLEQIACYDDLHRACIRGWDSDGLLVIDSTFPKSYS